MKIKTDLKNLDYYKIYLAVYEAVNEYLKANGFLQIDLPVLSPVLIPEAYLEVFETEFKFLDKKEKLYLTPSPELFLKRLLAYGIGDCYYLGKSFRNADLPAPLHSYEFTMVELYKTGADYMVISDIVLDLLRYIQKKLVSKNPKLKIKTDNLKLEKWEKISIARAFEKYADISESELYDHKLFMQKAKLKGYRIDGFNYEEIWSQIYTQEIEPNLGMNGYPALIHDYPKEFAALAKLNNDGKTTQRFEFYINGIELGDCYTELTDWKEQQTRFKKESETRRIQKKNNHPIDKGYVEALKYGLGDCSGIAIGLERLAMIFAGVDSIDKLKLINIY